jgi:hypothetical protein
MKKVCFKSGAWGEFFLEEKTKSKKYSQTISVNPNQTLSIEILLTWDRNGIILKMHIFNY